MTEQTASAGLESLAEDGVPTDARGPSWQPLHGVTSGAFATPVGGSAAAPAFPGESYSFTFDANPGDYLSFATMLVQSNDLFYAPDERGVGLFDAAGSPISGDITDDVQLWDAGTEMNEAPGAGPNQAPRQAGMDIGPDEDGTITEVDLTMSADGFYYPAVSDVIRVTIRPQAN